MLYSNISVNEYGHLAIAGHDTVALTEEFGTALMVLDEMRVRENCRRYIEAVRSFFPEGSMVAYASKALCFRSFYNIIKDEGFCADAVSPGEIFTINASYFPTENVFFHGNNKTSEDLAFAITTNVGYIVVDSDDELAALNTVAAELGKKPNVLLRLTPGIDPHTHAKISTGGIDSKFGTPIANGQATELLKTALSLENISVKGFHCHIGSQIFDCQPFFDAADIMLSFAKEAKVNLGFDTEIVNLGGGFAVRYVESDPEINIYENLKALGGYIKGKCLSIGIAEPRIVLEPGRSIVADACTTLYKVGSVKTIPGYKNYVSVDGGMTDNPRYTLYGSKYTVINASRADGEADFLCTLAGRCCESGDILQEDVKIAKPVRGDIVAVLTTGAYNYSMASNYNRLCRPALIILNGDDVRVGIRRETFDNLLRNDV
ncbi:MAG: diaminopimelate decarboxylase [Clostridia bacterium]|nr:diaminopimelate decarboxylase [Clostridia bacterium]